MTGLIKRVTSNFSLAIPFFNSPNWGQSFERNMDIIDAVLSTAGVVSNIVGPWENNTVYGVDDRVVDTTDQSVWQAAVAHTSAVGGTFAADRAANPTYWDAVSQSVVVRGAFVDTADYFVGDFVYDESELLGGIVIDNFTGDTNLRNNINDIGVIFDLKDPVDLAERWADEDEDVEVEPTKYSAKHWAAKTEETANDLALNGVPVGRIVMRFGPLDPGYIAWGEGGTFDRAVYPELATWLDNNGASLGLSAPQIAAGTIPDWRDYSPRTSGGALGPAVGAKQEDAFQGHTLVDPTNTTKRLVTPTGDTGVESVDVVAVDYSRAFMATVAGAGNPLVPGNNGVNGSPRSASETRVKSFGVRWQIKAFGAVVNQGTADLVAIAVGYQRLLNAAVLDDVDQNAQSKAAINKVNILKNTLQAWEQIGTEIKLLSAAASVDWTGLGAYHSLRIHFSCAPVVGDEIPRIRVGIAGVYDTVGNYNSQELRNAAGSVIGNLYGAATSMFLCGTGVGSSRTARGMRGQIMLTDFNEAVPTMMVGHIAYRQASGTLWNTLINGEHFVNAAQDSIRFITDTSAGFVAGSRFRLEGMRG